MFGPFLRVVAVIALVAVLAGIGIGVYNAGVNEGLTQAALAAQAAGEDPAVVIPPYAGPYGYGWGGGGRASGSSASCSPSSSSSSSSASCARPSVGVDGTAADAAATAAGAAAARSGSPSTTASCTSATPSLRRGSGGARAGRCGGPMLTAPSRTIREPMTTILVVDDEPKITRLVRDYLESAGFAVISARDGQEAVMRARTERPDLVVLDLGLPRLDGLDVTRRLRQDGDVPIIMLTARDDETDKLIGLELGADDYVTKPFSPRELVARVRAVLRRRERSEVVDRLVAGALALDVPRMRLEVVGPAGRADRDRVRVARRDGPPARPRLHPLAAARRHPRRRVRVVRAGDRRPRAQHPPQDRGGPAPASPPADRLRRRLPVDRCLRNARTDGTAGGGDRPMAADRGGGPRTSRGRRPTTHRGGGCAIASCGASAAHSCSSSCSSAASSRWWHGSSAACSRPERSRW